MFFKKKRTTSNATRNTHIWYKHWYQTPAFHPLATITKWSAGRNKKGQIVCWTKKSLKYNLPKISLLSLLYYNTPSCAISYYYQLKTHKLLLLSVNALGWFFYVPATEYRTLFNYFFVSNVFLLKLYFQNGNFFFLFQINKTFPINNIEDKLTHEIKYIKSNGTSGKILSTNFLDFSILIRLPSGAKKIFSRYVKASAGIVLLDKKKYYNTKSGYWRNLGWKSVVRGVAMNPIDHPHGGRTKSIKYPRTPWGKTTKYK